MIAVRSEDEIALLREANQIVAEVLMGLAAMVQPGITTADIDRAGADMIRKKGAIPAFLGYNKYPAHTCISVDEVIVHGIPGSTILHDGQIVSIDVGVKWKGFVGDAAVTVPCGKVDNNRLRLMKITDNALAKGIQAAKPGNNVRDISVAIQNTAEASNFSVVRTFVGHGIGARMHEEPQIPNFDTGQRGPRLRPGMVLAIEPMINMGVHDVRILKDGWTAVTADGLPSAHFEHSIVVREDHPEILSFTPLMPWGVDAA